MMPVDNVLPFRSASWPQTNIHVACAFDGDSGMTTREEILNVSNTSVETKSRVCSALNQRGLAMLKAPNTPTLPEESNISDVIACVHQSRQSATDNDVNFHHQHFPLHLLDLPVSIREAIYAKCDLRTLAALYDVNQISRATVIDVLSRWTIRKCMYKN